MSGRSHTSDTHKIKFNLGIQNVSRFYLVAAIFFFFVVILIEIPISSMMISPFRKKMGITLFVFTISFFALFSFKTSESLFSLIPFFFVISLISFPIYSIIQEPRESFHRINTKTDILPYCPKKPNQSLLPPIQPDKYVVFQPTNTGTGNRILAMVSAYALSLVTGRTFLIDWRTTQVFKANLSSLFITNIPSLSSIVPKNYSWSDNQYHFLNLVYCRQCAVRIRHSTFAQLATENLTKIFNRKFIFVRSNVYFAPDFIANPYHREILCSVFEPKHLFHSLYKKLFKLAPKIEKELNAILRPISNRDLIGIQIRVKDRVAFPIKKASSFFSCANYISSSYNNPLFFIASDSEDLKKWGKLFLNDVLELNKPTHNFSQEGIKNAVLDMMILSRCKEVILTPFSTFGAVAAGIGEIVPHFITRNEGFCVKDLTSEPKFHYWPVLAPYSIPSSSDMVNQDDSFL